MAVAQRGRAVPSWTSCSVLGTRSTSLAAGLHEALTSEADSLHLTVGASVRTWLDAMWGCARRRRSWSRKTSRPRPRIADLEEPGDGRLGLVYEGKRVVFPAHARDELGLLVETTPAALRDLPGRLDDEGLLTLARRLMREDFLRVIG